MNPFLIQINSTARITPGTVEQTADGWQRDIFVHQSECGYVVFRLQGKYPEYVEFQDEDSGARRIAELEGFLEESRLRQFEAEVKIKRLRAELCAARQGAAKCAD